ncbi:MAG: alkaline phosphatase family protein, partial [Alphaproteobacteria bacterium]|nr:alkaline phosphatase family protein [Alphaproteobacteria bacterium]
LETCTRVSSFVTGAYAGGSSLPDGANAGAGHGIMANSFYDPALGYDGPMDTSDTPRMMKAKGVYGRLQKAENLGETLSRARRKYAVLTTGKVGNARLLNVDAADLNQPLFSIWGADVSSPAANFDKIIERFGPVPEETLPNTAVADYATTVLLEHMIPDHDADVQVIWYNEPDLSYHYKGIGSPESDIAVRGVDAGFGRILDWWEATGRADGWQIIAASDHAQITVTKQINMIDVLNEAGFRAGKAISDDVDVAVKRSSSGQITVRDRDPALIAKVLAFLQAQDWCGLTFTRAGGDGALSMGVINALNERSPDINYILRSSDGANGFGYPGTCVADNADIPLGGGIHGGLQKTEINNLLVIGGDRIHREMVREVPTGIVDITPTMLYGLGIEAPDTAMGRALKEAFVDGSPAPGWSERIERASTDGYAQEMIVADVESGRSAYLRAGRRTA